MIITCYMLVRPCFFLNHPMSLWFIKGTFLLCVFTVIYIPDQLVQCSTNWETGAVYTQHIITCIACAQMIMHTCLSGFAQNVCYTRASIYFCLSAFPVMVTNKPSSALTGWSTGLAGSWSTSASVSPEVIEASLAFFQLGPLLYSIIFVKDIQIGHTDKALRINLQIRESLTEKDAG